MAFYQLLSNSVTNIWHFTSFCQTQLPTHGILPASVKLSYQHMVFYQLLSNSLTNIWHFTSFCQTQLPTHDILPASVKLSYQHMAFYQLLSNSSYQHMAFYQLLSNSVTNIWHLISFCQTQLPTFGILSASVKLSYQHMTFYQLLSNSVTNIWHFIKETLHTIKENISKPSTLILKTFNRFKTDDTTK